MSDPKHTDRNNQDVDQGSPQNGEPVFILVGKVRRPHGVDGELIIDAYSEDPERFKPGRNIFLGKDHLSFTVRSRRMVDKAMLITLKGLDDPDEAGKYRNNLIYVNKVDLPELPEGEYYHFDLIGLDVFDPKGNSLGKLNEVIETGANDVYVVTNEKGEEILVPAISQVIMDVSLAEHRMIVNPPEWI